MKIAILGKIIDTENIYLISEINMNSFWIQSMNDKIIHVEPVGFDDYLKLKITERDELRVKLENLRDSIIKIWSKNQSTIPQFNLE